MDTPLPAQIRPIQQEAGQATEADVMELVEMILGALGRDALGLGSSIAHPRESEEEHDSPREAGVLCAHLEDHAG